MISFSSDEVSKEGQKEIAFSLKEEGQRQSTAHGDRADAAVDGAVAPWRMVSGAVAGRLQVAVCARPH